MKHLRRHKYTIVLITSLIAFCLGLVAALWLHTLQSRSRFDNFETTFITPQQVVIFWKTKKPTVGYIKYGAKANERSTIVKQTSSEPSEVHAVMLDQLPSEGVYISIHEEGEGALIFPMIRHVRYQSGAGEEGGS